MKHLEPHNAAVAHNLAHLTAKQSEIRRSKLQMIPFPNFRPELVEGKLFGTMAKLSDDQQRGNRGAIDCLHKKKFKSTSETPSSCGGEYHVYLFGLLSSRLNHFVCITIMKMRLIYEGPHAIS
jgi:hypothetical protein